MQKTDIQSTKETRDQDQKAIAIQGRPQQATGQFQAR